MNLNRLKLLLKKSLEGANEPILISYVNIEKIVVPPKKEE